MNEIEEVTTATKTPPEGICGPRELADAIAAKFGAKVLPGDDRWDYRFMKPTEIDAKFFADQMERLLKVASYQAKDKKLEYVVIEPDGSTVATNGHILYSWNLPFKPAARRCLPLAPLKEAVQVIKASKAGVVFIEDGEKALTVEIVNRATLTVKVAKASYPNWPQIFKEGDEDDKIHQVTEYDAKSFALMASLTKGTFTISPGSRSTMPTIITYEDGRGVIMPIEEKRS